MRKLAKDSRKEGNIVVADFIILMDAIKKGRFNDTNKMFVSPNKYDVRVTEKNKELWAKKFNN